MLSFKEDIAHFILSPRVEKMNQDVNIVDNVLCLLLFWGPRIAFIVIHFNFSLSFSFWIAYIFKVTTHALL